MWPSYSKLSPCFLYRFLHIDIEHWGGCICWNTFLIPKILYHPAKLPIVQQFVFSCSSSTQQLKSPTVGDITQVGKICAWETFVQQQKMLQNYSISLSTQGMFLNSVVKSRFLYGYYPWRPTRLEMAKTIIYIQPFFFSDKLLKIVLNHGDLYFRTNSSCISRPELKAYLKSRRSKAGEVCFFF